jgi:hypothetical protein
MTYTDLLEFDIPEGDTGIYELLNGEIFRVSGARIGGRGGFWELIIRKILIGYSLLSSNPSSLRLNPGTPLPRFYMIIAKTVAHT